MRMAAAVRLELPDAVKAARYSGWRISIGPSQRLPCRAERAEISRDDSSGGCHADELTSKQYVNSREMTH
jgi:hypothetical protein